MSKHLVKNKPSKEQSAIYHKRWATKNPRQYLLTVAKSRSKRYGLDCEIELNDIEVPATCPILGIPIQLNFGTGNGGQPNSCSIDRVDNSKGYIKGNIQVISLLANQMKSTASPTQLLRFAEWINKTYG